MPYHDKTINLLFIKCMYNFEVKQLFELMTSHFFRHNVIFMMTTHKKTETTGAGPAWSKYMDMYIKEK